MIAMYCPLLLLCPMVISMIFSLPLNFQVDGIFYGPDIILPLSYKTRLASAYIRVITELFCQGWLISSKPSAPPSSGIIQRPGGSRTKHFGIFGHRPGHRTAAASPPLNWDGNGRCVLTHPVQHLHRPAVIARIGNRSTFPAEVVKIVKWNINLCFPLYLVRPLSSRSPSLPLYLAQRAYPYPMIFSRVLLPEPLPKYYHKLLPTWHPWVQYAHMTGY